MRPETPLFAALLLLLVFSLPGRVEGKVAARECRPQKAKEFLKRPSFVRKGRLDGRKNERALKFRVEQYGRVDGVLFAEANEKTARSQAVGTRFFGLPLSLHRAVVPALRCVERRIRSNCRKSKDQYRPAAVGGFRDANTFRGGEVSNHLFGIAIDIDPEKNPCCGCVDPWPEHPACKVKVENVLEQTAMPACWISAFERYGFYWLGRDPQLRDTMHFEFLGDPQKVMTGTPSNDARGERVSSR